MPLPDILRTYFLSVCTTPFVAARAGPSSFKKKEAVVMFMQHSGGHEAYGQEGPRLAMHRDAGRGVGARRENLGPRGPGRGFPSDTGWRSRTGVAGHLPAGQKAGGSLVITVTATTRGAPGSGRSTPKTGDGLNFERHSESSPLRKSLLAYQKRRRMRRRGAVSLIRFGGAAVFGNRPLAKNIPWQIFYSTFPRPLFRWWELLIQLSARK